MPYDMRTFGELFLSLIKAKYRNQTQFAYAVGNDDGYLSKIINGKQPAPDEELVDRWARALDLSGKALDEFHFAAEMTRVSPRIAARFAAMEALLDQQTKVIGELTLDMSKLRDLIRSRQDAEGPKRQP